MGIKSHSLDIWRVPVHDASALGGDVSAPTPGQRTCRKLHVDRKNEVNDVCQWRNTVVRTVA